MCGGNPLKSIGKALSKAFSGVKKAAGLSPPKVPTGLSEGEKLALQQQQDRERRIGEGRTKIDEAFAQYDPSYYDRYKESITGAQMPQLESQFGDARGQLLAALAERGMLESTNGAQQVGKLQEVFTRTQTDLANEAGNAARDLQSQVEKQKSDLYALNEASADPSSVSAQAAGAARAVAAPSAVSDIGRVFDAVLQPLLAYQGAAANSATRRTRGATTPVASGAGSSRNVG